MNHQEPSYSNNRFLARVFFAASNEGGSAEGLPYLTLAQAAQRAPGRPSIPTMWRLCRRGVLAKDGTRHFLQHTRLSRKILIPEGALEAFMAELSEADRQGLQKSPNAPRQQKAKPATARQRQIAEAEARLKAEGF